MEIFYFLFPKKFTSLHNQFRELKFVSRDFYKVYYLYFSIYKTKYFLVKSYNPYKTPAIQTIPFNIRYTKKNIWIDFEYNEEKKWNYCHLQQDSYREFFCNIQFLNKKDRTNRYLNLIESKNFKTYKKSECMRCKENTYCIIEKYFTKEGSYFNRMLKKMNNHFITVIFSIVVYQKICINTCIACKEYLDYHSELEFTYNGI